MKLFRIFCLLVLIGTLCSCDGSQGSVITGYVKVKIVAIVPKDWNTNDSTTVEIENISGKVGTRIVLTGTLGKVGDEFQLSESQKWEACRQLR